MKNKKNILIIAILLLSIFSCRKETEKFKPLSVEEEKIVGRWIFDSLSYDPRESAKNKEHIECMNE